MLKYPLQALLVALPFSEIKLRQHHQYPDIQYSRNGSLDILCDWIFFRRINNRYSIIVLHFTSFDLSILIEDIVLIRAHFFARMSSYDRSSTLKFDASNRFARMTYRWKTMCYNVNLWNQYYIDHHNNIISYKIESKLTFYLHCLYLGAY